MGGMDDDTLPPLPPVVALGRAVPLLSLVLAVAAVVAVWVLGFLPWVLDGFHLDVPGVDLNEVWLPIPLIAGQLTALIACTVVGSTAAMVLPLLVPAVPRPLAVVVTSLTVIATAVALVSIARISIADESGDDFASDPRVLDGLVVGVLALVVLCVVVGGLASFQIGFLPVAAAVVVTQLLSWITLLKLPHPDLVTELLTVVLLGGAFVVSVLRSPCWVATWPVALVVVWLGVPFGNAMAAVGSRLRPGQNLDESLGDVYRDGLDVFQASVWDSPRTWWPQVVAVGIGVGWLTVRHLLRGKAR